MSKQLTVGQLAEILSKQDQNAPVTLEGCDCAGDLVGASLGTEEGAYEGHVVLRVSNGVFSSSYASNEVKDA